MKFFSKNRLFISLLSSTLSSAFLVSPGHGMLPEDGEGIPPSRTTSLSLDESSSDDFYSIEFFTKMENLFYGNNAEDKQTGAAAFRKMAKDISHPYHPGAVYHLFSCGTKNDQREIAPLVREGIKDHDYPNRCILARNLIQSNDPEDKELGRNVLMEIFQNRTDQNYPAVARELLVSGTEEDKKLAITALCETVKDNTHPCYFDAAKNMTYFLEKFSEETHHHLFPVFSAEYRETLPYLLLGMLGSKYPNIQYRAEAVFFDNPFKFMNEYFFSKKMYDFLLEKEESKRDLYLQKIVEALQSSSLEDRNHVDGESHFNVACLALKMSDQEQFVTPAKQIFLKLIREQKTFLCRANSILKVVKHVEFKEKIISYLFDLAKNARMAEDGDESSSTDDDGSSEYNRKALTILLKQSDEKTQTEAITLCIKLLESIEESQIEQNEEFLSKMGLTLNKTEEGKAVAQQIVTLLSPHFECSILQRDIDSGMNREKGDALAGLFLNLGNENQQLEVYNFCKKIIMGEEDLDAIDNVIELFNTQMGEDHPWTQELLELAIKRANIDDPNNPFAVYKRLRKQIDQPVIHNIPQFQLPDGRSVTFNLKTLQTKRQLSFIPMKHHELVDFTEKLLVEAKESPEEFKTFATASLIQEPQSALKEVNKAFFKNLLDNDEESKGVQNVSLTSFKLRSVLRAAKELYHREGKEKEGAQSQGLPPSSQIILSLLNNALTCPTGKDDGIDATYRLLTNRRGGSEQDLQQTRLHEEICEFFQEEMRCMREGLLNGEGPVVRALLNVGDEFAIRESPHQSKYLHNLLGPVIGTFLEGKGITLDQNGGSVLPKLQECSKQQALDTLYQFHTPINVIRHFHERFNELGFNGTVDGKNTTSNILAEFLTPAEVEDSNYVIYNSDFDPISITPLAVAEILIRANILEVREND